MDKIVFIISAIFCGTLVARDDLRGNDFTEFVDRKTPSSYCGIYCLYSAAQALGVELRLERLIQDKYLTGHGGSSSSDLMRLAKDNGLLSLWKSGLTVEDLERSAHPMIMHVRPPASKRYSHWILFLGFEPDGKAKVYDPPTGRGKISKADLLAIWDGAALSVSHQSIRDPSWPLCIRTFSFAVCTVFLLSMLRKKLHSVWLIGTVTTVSALLASILPEGFLWNPNAVRNVSSAHFNFVLPTISKLEVQELIKSDKVILVDTRPEEAFVDFHLPGAINVPIGIGEIPLGMRLEELKAIVGERRVVAYCQSVKCGWADKVGSLIQQRSGVQLFVYEEGVNGWIAREND